MLLEVDPASEIAREIAFQWAPTLGGECYQMRNRKFNRELKRMFQWAPTLGGECYS